MNNEDIRNGTIFKERFVKRREIYSDHTTSVESCYDKVRKEMVIKKLVTTNLTLAGQGYRCQGGAAQRRGV